MRPPRSPLTAASEHTISAESQVRAKSVMRSLRSWRNFFRSRLMGENIPPYALSVDNKSVHTHSISNTEREHISLQFEVVLEALNSFISLLVYLSGHAQGLVCVKILGAVVLCGSYAGGALFATWIPLPMFCLKNVMSPRSIYQRAH